MAPSNNANTRTRYEKCKEIAERCKRKFQTQAGCDIEVLVRVSYFVLFLFTIYLYFSLLYYFIFLSDVVVSLCYVFPVSWSHLRSSYPSEIQLLWRPLSYQLKGKNTSVPTYRSIT